jgi:hypothetical protein
VRRTERRTRKALGGTSGRLGGRVAGHLRSRLAPRARYLLAVGVVELEERYPSRFGYLLQRAAHLIGEGVQFAAELAGGLHEAPGGLRGRQAGACRLEACVQRSCCWNVLTCLVLAVAVEPKQAIDWTR